MAADIAKGLDRSNDDQQALHAEIARAEMPFERKSGDLNRLRERLLDLMWEDVGIIRDQTGLQRALDSLAQIEGELLTTGVADNDRAFNLTWSDWLNLRSQIEISKVFAHAALKRENSRGAHFRTDFADPGDLATSRFTVVRQRDGRLEVSDAPVEFTIIKPGQTLLNGQEAAE